MLVRYLLLMVILLPGAHAAAVAGAQAPAKIVDLGDGKYRLGQIEIDKQRHSFTVPGTVIDLGPPVAPLEFLVIQRDGMKAYESLLEVDADAVQFNLACILIGFDADKAKAPAHLFDAAPVEGERVNIWVSWDSGDKKVRRPLGALVRVSGGEPVTEEWVYTGSSFGPGGEYLAQEFQVMVGAVHEPWSIIQHRSGLGIGEYGAMTYDPEVVPSAGTPVVLTVERAAAEIVSDSGSRNE